MIVCAGGAIWLNPFATVLFNVCSAVTEKCCVVLFVTVLCGCVWYVCCYVRKKALLQLLRGGICLLLGFGMGTMLANLDMCDIMLMLRAVFNMLVRNASPRARVV